MIVTEFISLGMTRDNALEVAGMSRHQYYHKAKPGKRGRKPTQSTIQSNGDKTEYICNEQVVDEMKKILEDPDLQYGYIKMSHALRQAGFTINKKKVYRLMRANHLLQDRVKFTGKTFVKFRKVIPSGPLSLLAMDIKMVWLEQHKRYAYILNVIDAFTRVILYHTVSLSIKQAQVKMAWESIIKNHLQPYDCLNKSMNVEVRNDNDKRFSAEMVQSFFKDNRIDQVFAHPYTPQENGYVESFHSILAQHLNRKLYWNIMELEQDLILFYEKYNNVRIHASTAYLPPNRFWEAYEEGRILAYCKIKNKKLVLKLMPANDENRVEANQAIRSQSEVSEQKNTSRRDTNFLSNKNGQPELPIEACEAIQYKLSPSLVSELQISHKNLTFESPQKK